MTQRDPRPAERHDIIALGASAGGIEPLLTVVRSLPPDLRASLFVVVHTPPHSPSRLPEILTRAGPLPATHARDGEEIVPGRIYVAPPDRHLLVRRGTVVLSRGPRENHTRPAIDPLFRSAARSYGARVVGVILSGALHDGAAGLMAIKARGGVAVVQHPDDAMVPSMSSRALGLVDADLILPAAQIGAGLSRLVESESAGEGETPMVDEIEHSTQVIDEDFTEQERNARADATTVYTCPDCGGVLWQIEEGAATSFRCHVGHAYAPEVLLGQKSEELEAALWNCVRLLREKATLTRQTSVQFGDGNDGRATDRAADHAALAEQHAAVIQELLEAMPSIVDLATANNLAASLSETGDPAR